MMPGVVYIYYGLMLEPVGQLPVMAYLNQLMGGLVT
jgi:hypothetical protein